MPYLHETTPEKEAQIAQEAFESNDLAHAVYHIGTALAYDPMRPEWLELLDQIIARSPDPLTLLRLDASRSDFVTAATRAYALAVQGKHQEALGLLSEVAMARPDAPFLSWASRWMKRQELAAAIPVEFLRDEVMPNLMRFLGKIPSPMDEEDRRHGNVEAASDLCQIFKKHHEKEPCVLFASAMAFRRLGKFDYAIYDAYQGFQVEKNWNNCIGVACAYRDAGKTDDAVAWFRHALALDPEDVTALLDMGATLIEAERYDEAIGAFEEILAKNPDHPKAVAYLHFTRFKKTGDVEEKNALFRLADRSGDAWGLYCELGPIQPYIHMLPAPADASAKPIHEVIRMLSEHPERAEGGTVNLTVTHLESPSVLNAFRFWRDSKGYGINVELEVENIQTPDPRVPKAQINTLLWTYDGTTALPNAMQPSPEVHSAVGTLANDAYNVEMWAPKAQELAAQLGTEAVHQIIGSMVYPPPLPDADMDPLFWVQKCQIAAALIIGYLDDGWGGSIRKQVLWELTIGPVDWVVDAAIITLGWLARQIEEARPEVEALFGWLESQIPQEGYTCFEYPLVTSWLGMGGHDEATAQRLDEWKQRVEEKLQPPPGPEGGGEPERHGGLTLEEYAQFSVLRDAAMGRAGAAAGIIATAGSSLAGELEALCSQFGFDVNLVNQTPGNAIGRIPEWDEQINSNPAVQEVYFALQHDAKLKSQGVEFNSHEGRVAEMIRAGHFDTDAAAVDAQAAAQQMAQGEGGDPDPVVFPGAPLEKLSDYVGMMKIMQTGDMQGALAKYGLDMGSYSTIAQAWGVKLASDPVLNAKFSEMMQR